MAIMGRMGYRKRTSFLAGLTVAQISEFSLILGALGLSLGHVDIQNGYDAFSLDNDRRTRSDEPGRDAQKSTYGALTADWQINDAVVLEGSLGHASSDIDYGYDEDWTFVGFHPFGYASTDRYLRERDTGGDDAVWRLRHCATLSVDDITQRHRSRCAAGSPSWAGRRSWPFRLATLCTEPTTS